MLLSLFLSFPRPRLPCLSILTACCLLLFFRSFRAVIISMSCCYGRRAVCSSPRFSLPTFFPFFPLPSCRVCRKMRSSYRYPKVRLSICCKVSLWTDAPHPSQSAARRSFYTPRAAGRFGNDAHFLAPSRNPYRGFGRDDDASTLLVGPGTQALPVRLTTSHPVKKKKEKEKKNIKREIRFLLRSPILLQEELSLKAPTAREENTPPLHSAAPDLPTTTASSSSLDSASHFTHTSTSDSLIETLFPWTCVGQGMGVTSAR
jgi:hypothetical protein